MVVKYSRRGQLFSACEGFPRCRNSMNLPEGIKYMKKLDKTCPDCEEYMRGPVHLLRLQFAKDFAENSEISEILE